MNTYEFTIELIGVNKVTPCLENALYEAGCSDGLICSCNETVYIDFSRASSGHKDAVTSAIKDIESAGCTAKELPLNEND